MTVCHMIQLFKMESEQSEEKLREEKSNLNHLKDGISKCFSESFSYVSATTRIQSQNTSCHNKMSLTNLLLQFQLVTFWEEKYDNKSKLKWLTHI